MNAKLNAKIEARNLAIATMNELGSELARVLSGFKGSKAMLATGEFSTKLKKAINDRLLRFRLKTGVHTIYWGNKEFLRLTVSCVSVLNGCAYYQEINNYFGQITNQILVDVYEYKPMVGGFDAKAIEETRKELIEARKKVSQLECDLVGFGEFDF
jgi:hypothetical protein